MASKSLGTLTLDLIAQVGGFVSGMDKAGRSSEKWRAQVEKSAKAVGTAVGAGVAAGVTALAALTVSAVNSAVEIDNLSSVANVSTTDFQKLAAGAKVVGIEQGQLADILKDVNDKVGDFLNTGGGEMADFFEQIAPKVGVTADQFRNLSGSQALGLYVSSLEKAKVSQSEMTFYLEAIANDATLLLPLLRNNSDGFRRFGDAAQAAGAIMDDKTIRAAQELKAATWLVDQSVSGLTNQITSAMLPTLANFATGLNDTTINGVLAKRVSDDLAGSLRVLGKFAVGVVAGIHMLGVSLKSLSDIDDAMVGGAEAKWWDRYLPPVRIYNAFKNVDAIGKSIGAAKEQLGGLATGYGDLMGSFDEKPSGGTNQVKELADLLAQMRKGGAGTFTAITKDQQAVAKAAEAAQKKLQGQFDTAEEGYKREIALINTAVDKRKEATEVAKLQFEIESGRLNGITSLQQAKLKGLAEELDKLKQLKIANEENAKAASYASTLASANATAQSGLNMEFVGAGMGSKTRERLQGILEIRQEFDQKYADLQAQRNSGDISESLFKREAELLQSSLEERLSMQVDYYSKQDELQTNWLDGAKDAWQDYADHARDLSSQMYDVTSNALGSLEDELVGFVKTGEFNFSDFAEGIADDLLHMLVKVGLQMAVNAAIGNSSAAASAALAAATGTAMAAAYAPAAAMASLASFGANAAPASAAITSTTGLASSLALVGMAHDGIDSVPREGTWLLQKGERVTTAGTSAKLDRTLSDIQANGSGQGGIGSLPPIQQQIIVQGSADDATLARIQEAAKQGAQLGYQMVLKDFRSNGPARQQLRKG
ncbi:phage tail tape measure protein [Pseudomonas putida]|uniref:phage tail tape measure protein n=1 Tax=Pseudomonas putida TaxID=303 RepID=UPI001059FFEE|nr:phage tail tape measure protein [Pseudomonas putida]TDJ74733.1 phage tail tape measure protein [Pseudomonas putida]